MNQNNVSTPEEEEEFKQMERSSPQIIVGASGAQYQFMDTSPYAQRMQPPQTLQETRLVQEMQALTAAISRLSNIIEGEIQSMKEGL